MSIIQYVQDRRNRIVIGGSGIGLIIAAVAGLSYVRPALLVETPDNERLLEITTRGAIGVGTGATPFGALNDCLKSGGGSGQMMTFGTCGGGLAIGDTVTSGTDGAVLFISGSVLAENPTKFHFENSNPNHPELRLGTSDDGGDFSLFIKPTSVNRMALMIKGLPGQVQDILEVQDSDGFPALQIENDLDTFWNGDLQTADLYVFNSAGYAMFSDGTNNTVLFGTTTDLSSMVGIIPLTTTDIGLVIQGLPAQTANLQEWRDSAGTKVGTMNDRGDLEIIRTGSGRHFHGESLVTSSGSMQIEMPSDSTSAFTIDGSSTPYLGDASTHTLFSASRTYEDLDESTNPQQRGLTFTMTDNNSLTGTLELSNSLIGLQFLLTKDSEDTLDMVDGGVSLIGLQASITRAGLFSGGSYTENINGSSISIQDSQSFDGGAVTKALVGNTTNVQSNGVLLGGSLNRSVIGQFINVSTNPSGDTTAYGLYLSSVAGGDANYSIYDITGKVAYFNSNVGINNLTPKADLDVLGTMSGTALVVSRNSNFSGSGVTISATGSTVFNEQSRNVDFRIEGDTDDALLFLDASTDRVGIGTRTPDTKLEVSGTMSGSALVVDGTATIEKILTATATLDFPSTAAVGCDDLTITVNGAADGDTVIVGSPNGSYPADSFFHGFVSAANTVTVRHCTNAAISDPASGTFRATIIKY